MLDIDEFNKYILDGKVKSYPSKKHRQIRPYLYEYLITKFDIDKEYNEKEINDVILNWILFDDYCLVRREMIEQGLLKRSNDCKYYYVNKDYQKLDK